jgi:hypothetical protein
MLPTHQFTQSKLTKYFGISINSEFVKLQSKKASMALCEAVYNGQQINIFFNAIYDTNNQLITKVTRINSHKISNYLLNQGNNLSLIHI